MTEQWRPVLGWEGFYEVSDLAEVRGLERVIHTMLHGRLWPRRIPERRMTIGFTSTGYGVVALSRDGKMTPRTLHSLVMEAFVGPRPEGRPHIRHLNGDRLDNRLENLAYGTVAENQQDSIRHGTQWQVRKTHCPQGHEYTPENTKLRRGGKSRHCRTCQNFYVRQSHRRRAESSATDRKAS